MKSHYASLACIATLFVVLAQPSKAQVFAPNTVTVVGLGVFGMKPDTVAISIHTIVSSSSMEATNKDASDLTDRVNAILKTYNADISASLIANARSVGRGQVEKAGPAKGDKTYEIIGLQSASSTNAEKVSELISDLVNMDERVSISLVWGMKDPEPLKARALELATQDAERQKDLLAKSFKLSGGKLISVSTVTSGDMKSYSDNGEMPIVAGKNSAGMVVVSTRVVATFALEAR